MTRSERGGRSSVDAGSPLGYLRSIASPQERSVRPSFARFLALASALVLTAVTVSVLYDAITSVVGGTRPLLIVTALALVTATVASRLVGPRTVGVVAAVAAPLGFGYYLAAAGIPPATLASAAGEVVGDTLTLLSGLRLVRLAEADVWARSFAPLPAFLTWYLALRRRYALAVVPGGAALLFLVATGDATTAPALAGTGAAVVLVAAGELDRHDGRVEQLNLLAAVLALAVVCALFVPVFPGGSEPSGFGGSGGAGTLEGSVIGAGDRSAVGGAVDLSPEVRFTVESDRAAYWRTGVYDRFTGDEWVRSGQSRPYDGGLEPPSGVGERVTQTVTLHERATVMPAAAQPVRVEGDLASNARVTSHGHLRPEAPLVSGDSYTVQSVVVDRDPGALRAAGTDYPDAVADTYLQTPSGSTAAFEAYAEEVAADAETPYDTAAAIEAHLRSTKGYSLDVDAPQGNAAETFLFDMEAGYCVHFATTMTQLLRAQDVPARYVTGYTAGEQVGDDEWVVRGLDAHAWVEVYFPGQGWVPFDPTPPTDRSAHHGEALSEARANDVPNVDTEESADAADESDDPTWNDSTEPGSDEDSLDLIDPDRRNDTDEGNATPDAADPAADVSDSDEGADDGPLPSVPLPSPSTAATALVVLVGAVASVRHVGAVGRLRRGAGIYWQRRRSPAADVERAFHRLDAHLARRHRPRRPGETPRAYLDALAAATDQSLDPRVWLVIDRYERVVYADEAVDRAVADETVATVDAVTRATVPVVGRWWRRRDSGERYRDRGRR